MALKIQTTSALHPGIRTAMHQEADHDPCFNPEGVFPVVGGGSCAGWPLLLDGEAVAN
jgi:hypothetical protein